jgi:hypothetical protein
MIRGAAVLILLAAVLGCGREPRITLAAGQVASAPTWSPDGRCVALVVSDAEGHSPLTTTHVAVARAGDASFGELRLPAPNERFSTLLEQWESPGVLRVRAITLEGEVQARYRCDTGQLEIVR